MRKVKDASYAEKCFWPGSWVSATSSSMRLPENVVEMHGSHNGFPEPVTGPYVGLPGEKTQVRP